MTNLLGRRALLGLSSVALAAGMFGIAMAFRWSGTALGFPR